jgi:hypothetical protein
VTPTADVKLTWFFALWGRKRGGKAQSLYRVGMTLAGDWADCDFEKALTMREGERNGPRGRSCDARVLMPVGLDFDLGSVGESVIGEP